MGWLSNLFGGKKPEQTSNKSVIQDLNRRADSEKSAISGGHNPEVNAASMTSKTPNSLSAEAQLSNQESVMAAKASFTEMPELNTAELKNVMSGRKVIAIKLYRDRTNVSLKAAKEYIDYVDAEIESGNFPIRTKDQEN